MAFSKMKLANVIGPLEHVDDVAKVLGDSGVFQIDDVQEFFPNNHELIPLTPNNEFTSILDRVKNIIINSEIEAEVVDPEEYKDYDNDKLDLVVKSFEEDIDSIVQERNELSQEIAKCEENINHISRFVGLSVEVHKLNECEYLISHFGKLPKDSYEKLIIHKDNPYVHFEPTSNDGETYWGVYICPKNAADDVDRIFSSLYFEEIELPDIDMPTQDYLDNENKKLDELNEKYNKVEEKISSWGKSNKDKVLKVFSKLCELNAYNLIKNKTYKFRKTFMIVGWIPTEYEGLIKKELEEIDSVEASFTDAKDEAHHNPPAKLKNRFFSRPFEYYTEMYGLPNYNEIDPSAFIAFTYSILFGIMFADVGQGIVLLLISLYMYLKMKMPLGRLLIPCSICSTIFGFVFGSVFGFEHVLDPIYKAVFGLNEKPIDVLDSNSITLVIYTAIGIGVFLLIVAMCLNIYSSFRRKDFSEALFSANGLAGLVFYVSLVVGLVCQLLMGIPVMNALYVLLLIVLPLILVFMKEPLSKLLKGKKDIFPDGIGSFIAESFFELFETVLSYLTNTMSFLRVGAFVLVHAGMMMVVFAIAEMFSTPGYIITVVIGNIIVIALEGLLVGIQVLRLEYYEMFSKFYTGDGREYKPIKTKQIDN